MSTEVTTTDGLSLFQVIDQSFADVTAIDDDTLAQFLDSESGVLSVFERARAEVQRRLETGGSVPGYALQPGRGSHQWNADEDTIVKVLKARRFTKDEIYPPKLISVAQALKSDKLTKEQKDRLEKEHVAFVAGELKVTKVSRPTQSIEDKASVFQDVVTPAVIVTAEATVPEFDFTKPLSFL